MEYDLIIIGGGIGGLLSAYRALELHPGWRIALFERGDVLEKRHCPISSGRAASCIHCGSCAIMEGLAGAGAFSDGKFVKSTEYGGWLPDHLGGEQTLRYIDAVDDILMRFGATDKVYRPAEDLKAECARHNLHLQQAVVKHLGSDGNYTTMQKLIDYLRSRIEIHVKEVVYGIEPISRQITTAKGTYGCGKLIIAVGRVGAQWFEGWCHQHSIPVENNQVDIGVRVELPRSIWAHISDRIYEPKILYTTRQYGDICRTFCFNVGGHVVMENSDGVLTVNGHAFADEGKKSGNSNFALLSTTKFTQPFDQPLDYLKHIAQLGNMISGGSVIVQRFGDLLAGRRSTEERIAANPVRPTLAAIPGDLSLCLPKRQLDNIIETMRALDNIAPGTAASPTLLYGVEAKYYSIKPRFLNGDFEIASGIYALGDGSGVTRSLSQAGAMGLYVAERL
ncbi:MAG: FAD-dependent oxidoreductase [Clostridiales bacterium]|nr:FAD-dependent oxidoreductase [Clostridiales bacterium]